MTNSAAAILAAFVFLLSLVLFQSAPAKGMLRARSWCALPLYARTHVLDGAEMERLIQAEENSSMYISRGVIVVFICGACNGILGTTTEFIGAPITQRLFGFEPFGTALLVLAIALSSILTITLLSFAQQVQWVVTVGERFWQIESYVIMMLGIVLCYLGVQQYAFVSDNVRTVLFCVGLAIEINSWSMLTATLNPLLSRLVPARDRVCAAVCRELGCLTC
jgi:hypothetical protein